MKIERMPLSGGIGNQLFQVAASLYFANLQGQSIALMQDSGRKASKLIHASRIDALGMPISIESKISYASYFYRLDRKLINNLDTYANFRKIQVQKEIGYDPEFIILDDTREVRGYFQSYKYIESFKSIFKEAIHSFVGSQFFHQSKLKAHQVNPVSLHIRRGDYELLKSKHGTLSGEYYDSGLITLSAHHNIDYIWVFSDEPEKARYILRKSRYLGKMDFEIGSNLNEIETLVIMTLCRGHIIANSTYSWWGAIMSELDNAVIAPREWFFKGDSPNELLPVKWVKIPSIWEI